MSAQKKVKKSKGRGRRVFFILFALTLVFLYGIIYLMPTVSDAITQTVVLEYSTIQLTQEISGYIVRDEGVYFSDRTGTINYFIEDDTKVRKNTKVVDISVGSADHSENQYPTILNRIQGVGSTPENHYTVRNGVVTYFIDGYEGYFSPYTMETLDRTEVEKLEMRIYNVVRNTTLPDEPLYKLVQDDKWHVIFWVEPEYISRYEAGNSVTLKLPLEDVKGKVHSVTDDNGYGRIILEFDRSYIDFTKQRKIEGTVITEDASGLVVPNTAFAMEDQQVGVYLKQVSGDYVFTRVFIITTDGEHSLVKTSEFYEEQEDGTNKRINTVQLYDEVLRDGSDISKRGG